LTAFGALIAYFSLPETRANDDINRNDPNGNSQKKWRPNFEFYGVITLNGINRFITAGVFAATLALLVQDQLPKTNLILGVATVTGVLFGLRTILSMFAAPLSGTLSDKLGNRWGVTIAVLLIGAIGMLLLVSSNFLIIFIGICFTAVAGGSTQALMTTRTGDLVDQAQRGKAIGSLHTAGDLGSALGPLTAYALLGWLSLSGLFLMCAVLFALGAGLAGLIFIRQRTFSNEPVN
jgi:MFS family permease